MQHDDRRIPPRAGGAPDSLGDPRPDPLGQGMACPQAVVEEMLLEVGASGQSAHDNQAARFPRQVDAVVAIGELQDCAVRLSEALEALLDVLRA